MKSKINVGGRTFNKLKPFGNISDVNDYMSKHSDWSLLAYVDGIYWMQLTKTFLKYPHIVQRVDSLKFDIQKSNYLTSVLMGDRPPSMNQAIMEMRTGQGLDLDVVSELLKCVNDLNKNMEYELKVSKHTTWYYLEKNGTKIQCT